MSKASKRKDRTEPTRKIKDANVLKSSHGKFATVFDLEKKREETTTANKKKRKNKKDD